MENPRNREHHGLQTPVSHPGLLHTLLAPAAGHRMWQFCHQWHWQREKHPSPFSPLQVHIPAMCFKETCQKEQLPHSWCSRETFLVADTTASGGSSGMPGCSCSFHPSSLPAGQSPFILCLHLKQGQAAQRRTGHCAPDQSRAQLEKHSSAEPNQPAQPMDSCNSVCLWQKSRAMKGKQTWSILWAGSSPGNTAQHPPFARESKPSSYSHLLWDEDGHL